MNKLQQTLLPIKVEASEERLTSLAGLIVVEELAQAKGLWRQVDELLPQPGSGRGYRASAYVKPLVWMLQAGGRRLEDMRELRAEQGVLRSLGLEELPSADAVGDWLRRTGTQGVEGLQPVNRELVASTLAAGPEELTLDVDATIIEAEKQEADTNPWWGTWAEWRCTMSFERGMNRQERGRWSFCKGARRNCRPGRGFIYGAIVPSIRRG
jgi:hypothetical protein